MAVDESVLLDADADDDAFEDLLVDDTPHASTNVLDALKAQRASVARSRTYDLVVPGWRDLLMLRLGPITSQQQQRLASRIGSRSTANLDAGLLVSAFREAYGRARTRDPWSLLVDDDGDAVGLDRRLAQLLDLGPVTSAREVLDKLFANANAPAIAISTCASEWVEWARDASDEIDEDFLGE